MLVTTGSNQEIAVDLNIWEYTVARVHFDYVWSKLTYDSTVSTNVLSLQF